jgi:hypothetical protein
MKNDEIAKKHEKRDYTILTIMIFLFYIVAREVLRSKDTSGDTKRRRILATGFLSK